ncbi:hypothetical protein ACLOJK_021814 [Asimina triloba]
MGKNCNLELRLVPAGIEADLPSSDTSQSQQSTEESAESSQQLTILYDGHICVCDVTEIQARAILCFASGETEESAGGRCLRPSSQEPQLHAPAVSMKRSLQRFLQKRKTRIMTTSPYKH